MSTSQRASDNKVHRHMQAISMLLGHRGKTPSMIKQRTKSPISVIHAKTPRINNMLKYQQFFSSLLKIYQMNKLKHKRDFFSRLKLQPEQHHYPKYQISTPVQQPKRTQNQKYNRRIKSAQTIKEFIDISTNKLLMQAFQTLKHCIPDQTKNVLRVNKTHRKMYSQMYTNLVHNARSRSPSTIYNYEYRTPEVTKEIVYESKSNQARIIVQLSEKILFKKISSAFSQLKSHSTRSFRFQLKQIKQNQDLNKQENEQINRQISTLVRKNKLMEKQLQQSDQKLKQFSQKVNQLQNEIILTTKSEQNLKKQNETLRRLTETTKKQLQARNRQLESVKKQFLSQKTINEKNIKESMSLRRQFENMQKQCELTKKQLTKRSQELSSVNEQFKLSKEKFETKLKAIEKGPNPLESLMRELQSQKKELQSEMMKQKSLKKDLERKLIKFEKQIQDAGNLILQMEETGKQNAQIIKSQQKQILTVKKQFQKVKKELETTKKQTETMKKELETLRKERLYAQNQLQSMKKQQVKRQQELQSINRELQNKERQIDMKEKQFLLRQQQLNEMQKQLSNKQKQLESSKKQFDQKLKSESKNSKEKQSQSAVLIDMDLRDSELQSLKKQLLLSKQQYYQATNSLLVSQKLLNEQKEKTFLLSQKQQEKQNEFLLHDQQKKAQLLDLQRKVAGLIIHKILATKFNSRTSKFFQALSQIKIIKSSIHSNCLFMERVINDLLKDRKKSFFKRLSQTPVKHYSEKEIQFVERSLTSQIKIKSIYSSKHSLSNASLISNNFDQFAKKINKAFELKTTLHQIYQYCFQKIDYAALIYLGISNPLNKLIHKHMMDGYRKILFFSFSKNQQSKINLHLDDSQVIKRSQKILSFLKKLDNKIVFTKIQAYSLLKINAELKKNGKVPDESIISQSELKRELNDFLLQRNKVYQKTFQTWQRTKQMISEYKLVSSQRSY